MIHDRIRRARILKGLSLEALAQRMGDISKQALNKFEKGESLPSSTRLLQLGDALGVGAEYFFRQEEVELAPLEFRKLARMGKRKLEQVTEHTTEHLERYIALEACFDAANIEISPMPSGYFAVSSLKEAEDAAIHLREQWRIGTAPIANLTELLEEHGIKVVLLDGPEDFDGACAVTRDNLHVLIALNAHRPGERMRFTAAHELGHWVMAFPQEMEERDAEYCCHRFAGAFLYPASCVTTDFGGHQRSRVHLRELSIAKQLYGLSMQAVLRRLKDLELLSEAGYRSSMIHARTQGWAKAEPDSLPPEHPQRFESLVYWGLAEDLFSRSRAAEFLGTSASALDANLSKAAAT